MPRYERPRNNGSSRVNSGRGNSGRGRSKPSNRSFRASRGSSNRDSRDNRGDRSASKRHGNFRRDQPTSIECAECKKRCEVPFKPTQGKPVLCSECYSKKGRSNNNNSAVSGDDIIEIKQKLDKIIAALNINQEE